MAQTLTERVTALERIVQVQIVRLDGLEAQIKVLVDKNSEMGKELIALHRDFDRDIALLKREVEEMKKSQEEWGRKLWMILPPVLAALLGSALTAAVAFSSRK